MGGKTSSIGGRISDDLRRRLTAITERYGPVDTRLLEDALTALADFVEAEGRYVRPVRMVAGDAFEGGVNEAGHDPQMERMRRALRAAMDERDNELRARGRPVGGR